MMKRHEGVDGVFQLSLDPALADHGFPAESSVTSCSHFAAVDSSELLVSRMGVIWRGLRAWHDEGGKSSTGELGPARPTWSIEPLTGRWKLEAIFEADGRFFGPRDEDEEAPMALLEVSRRS